MRLYRNPKYRNKTSLHVADYLRGETVGSAEHQTSDQHRYQCLGFLFTRGIVVDPQDVDDFKHMRWYRIELDSDLKMGVLPEGLLLRSPKGEVMVVRDSALVPLDGQLREVG